jgi:hypothetical protein
MNKDSVYAAQAASLPRIDHKLTVDGSGGQVTTSTGQKPKPLPSSPVTVKGKPPQYHGYSFTNNGPSVYGVPIPDQYAQTPIAQLPKDVRMKIAKELLTENASRLVDRSFLDNTVREELITLKGAFVITAGGKPERFGADDPDFTLTPQDVGLRLVARR